MQVDETFGGLDPLCGGVRAAVNDVSEAGFDVNLCHGVGACGREVRGAHGRWVVKPARGESVLRIQASHYVSLEKNGGRARGGSASSLIVARKQEVLRDGKRKLKPNAISVAARTRLALEAAVTVVLETRRQDGFYSGGEYGLALFAGFYLSWQQPLSGLEWRTD